MSMPGSCSRRIHRRCAKGRRSCRKNATPRWATAVAGPRKPDSFRWVASWARARYISAHASHRHPASQAQQGLMELPEQVPGAERSQFALLTTRRFLPFFLTQFFGAFNDNLFRNALVVSITFGATAAAGQAGMLSNAAQGLFILPFFLFSALAGQIADKY